MGPQGSNLALFPLLNKDQTLFILYGPRLHYGFEQYARAADIRTRYHKAKNFLKNSEFSLSHDEIKQIVEVTKIELLRQ